MKHLNLSLAYYQQQDKIFKQTSFIKYTNHRCKSLLIHIFKSANIQFYIDYVVL